jgi:PPOX class probable F420-dependent enzyme
MGVISDRERAFLTRRRIGHLATADARLLPHLVPVCFALCGDTLYTAVDEKPKRVRTLKRLSNIVENPHASFLADHYDEDWSRLGWVRIDGNAEILEAGRECDCACILLVERYKQYAAMRLDPVIAVRAVRTRSWGALDW